MTFCVLGRQPKIGLAELESLFGSERVSVISEGIAAVDAPIGDVTRQELGGSIKVADLLAEVPRADFGTSMDFCRRALPEHLLSIPEGKIKLGLSVYGFSVNPKNLEKAGLNLKKVVKGAGRSVRVVPNTELALNSAQVLHNKLTSELGLELLFINAGNRTIIARTAHVQDIESYARRDRGRPKRDPFVGMLPPKLAQTMIHLATPKDTDRILDPFCGTGVLLQEAALFGHPVYGTDLSDKMIRYSTENLEWLKRAYRVDIDSLLEEADAQDHIWRQPVNTVVCETYLGQPLSGLPSREKLEEIIHGCNSIARHFLKNISEQVEPGSRHCIALPAWRVADGFRHLAVIDEIDKLGFKRVEFSHATQHDLIYHREDQIVARELLVLIKK